MLEKFRIEVWKDIRGYENLYQVSNFGHVRSLDKNIVRKNGEKLTVHGKVLKPKIMDSLLVDYNRINLSRWEKDIKDINELEKEEFENLEEIFL